MKIMRPGADLTIPAMWARLAAFVLLLIGFAGTYQNVAAQDGPVLRRGDAVVTGFSGVDPQQADGVTRSRWLKQFGFKVQNVSRADVPSDVHPLDRSFIDPERSAAQIFDLSAMIGLPAGQLADSVVRLKIKAGDIGQVFAVALDGEFADRTPNIYLGATSRYGLQIVAPDGSGGFRRLLQGEPGAQWMPGQFGTANGGGPGSIWKVDGRTGNVSLFANIKNGSQHNSGPGIGAIAFDATSGILFASDLETGLIQRFDQSGKPVGTFDHGITARPEAGLDALVDEPSQRMDITSGTFNTEDPSTWGYTVPGRMITGLAIADRRLLYAVGDGPQVWSVGIGPEGAFTDNGRLEIDLKNDTGPDNITGMTFDGAGALYLSQRGAQSGSYDYSVFAAPQQAVVMRYKRNPDGSGWSQAPQEYAIGLKPQFRAAEGGVALGYGYDRNGNIDFGSCRQTVWTTGGALRDGEDIARVTTGGASIVNGLQGNATSLVRPANEPPYQSYFVDYDGRFEDAEARGHMGSIAVYAPCDPKPQNQVAPVPQPEALPEPGITIAKQCLAGAIGGKVQCTITVRNVGETMPSAPVIFSEATRIIAGPGAGTLIAIAAASPDGPEWACSPTPSADFSCSLPGIALPPGTERSVDVWVDTGGLILAGNLGFRNCATLKHPDGFGRACAEAGAEIVVEKTGPAACNPGGGCKFGVTITNFGLSPFDGDLLIADGMTVGGAGVAAPITAIMPPLGCAAEPVTLPFSCVTHASLAPGESRTHWITVTMPAAPPAYWAQNCFAAVDPLLVPPGPPPPGPGPLGAGSNPSCVWVPVGPVAAFSNLRIEKTALNGGLCAKAGDVLSCDYEIGIVNESLVPFHDIIKFSETLPAGGTLAIPAPWMCAGGPPGYECTTAAAVDIPAGGTLTIPARIDIAIAATEATGCEVPNTVAIMSPVAGSPANADAADDNATAFASTFGIEFEVFGVTIVVCDPTNLKTTKIVKSGFVKSAQGYEGEYLVTVRNTGPDPFHGPIEINEQLSFAPSLVSFSAPWVCEGGGAAFHCRHPHADLEKGDSVELTVKVTIPDGPQCRLVNTAIMTFPVAGSKANGKGSDDKASATANIPSPRCKTPPPERVPPLLIADPIPFCPDGRPRLSNGYCPCPLGTRWDRLTRQCERETPRCLDKDRLMPNGRCCPWGTEWSRDTRSCRVPPRICPDQSRRQPNGACCPAGTRWDAKARTCKPVIAPCPDGKPRGRDGSCRECPQGMRWNIKLQRCEKPADDGAIQCPDGSKRASRTSPCPCPQPKRWNVKLQRCELPELDCPRGQIRHAPTGRCVPEPKECPVGFTGTPPNCVKPDKVRECPKGYSGTPPNCKPETPRTCPDGFIGTQPNCRKIPVKECPAGTTGKFPDCKKIEPPKCPEGTTGSPPNCKKIEVKRCPSGTAGVYPNCKKVEPPKCPVGTTGSPPNCKKIEVKTCPRGTTGVYPNCKPAEIAKCPPGTIGRPPNCKKIVVNPPVQIQKQQPRPAVSPQVLKKAAPKPILPQKK